MRTGAGLKRAEPLRRGAAEPKQERATNLVALVARHQVSRAEASAAAKSMAPKKSRGRRGAARPLNETQTSLLKKMLGVSVLCSLSAGALWLVARRVSGRSGAAPRAPAEAPVLDWSTDGDRWPDSVAVGAALSVEECGRVLRDLETAREGDVPPLVHVSAHGDTHRGGDRSAVDRRQHGRRWGVGGYCSDF